MAKRKQTEVLEVNYEVITKETDKPKCYDGKKPYCKKELCQEWYDSCKDSDKSDELF